MNKTILIKSAADVFFLLVLWSLFGSHYAGLFFVAPYVLALFLFGSYQSRISYFSVVDVATLLFISILIFSLHSLYLRSVPTDLVLFYSLSFVGLMALRLGLYAYHNLNLFFPNFKSHNKLNDIIIGAGEATAIYLSQKISTGGHVIGIFDDDVGLIGKKVGGVEVIDRLAGLANFLLTNHIDRIIYMIPSINIDKHKTLFTELQARYPKIQILAAPSLNDINVGLKSLSELSSVTLMSVNETPVDLNLSFSKKNESNQTALVTGGAGSIGSVIVEKLLALDFIALVVVIDQDEHAVYRLSESLPAYITSKKLIIHLGDYADLRQMRSMLIKYKPQTVYHAAAYKHVNLLESDNVYSAVNNNCIKAIKLAEEVKSHSCIKTFLLVSTDKAVKPSNIMGLTKRFVEISLNQIFNQSSVNFITVRFGNVVGSNGSVFHKFLRQIENRQKITLTDRLVTRYFMNISQAASLIIKSSLIGKDGKVYVLNMGDPIKIYDFVVSMIRKHGSHQQVDDIVITGLMPGEKLHEELYYKHEKIKALDSTVFEGQLKRMDFKVEQFKSFFDELPDTSNEAAIKKFLGSIKIE